MGLQTNQCRFIYSRCGAPVNGERHHMAFSTERHHMAFSASSAVVLDVSLIVRYPLRHLHKYYYMINSMSYLEAKVYFFVTDKLY